MVEKPLRFKVKLEGVEGTALAWLNAPFDVVETFGTRARVPVRGTINGFRFRSSLMPMGGCTGWRSIGPCVMARRLKQEIS